MSQADACFGKRGWQSFEDARREAGRLARSGRMRDGNVNAYRCPQCGLFHVGARLARKARRIPRYELD